MIEVNVGAISKLYRQKLLMDGFICIKMDFERKRRIEAAYHNVNNLTVLNTQIINIVTSQTIETKR